MTARKFDASVFRDTATRAPPAPAALYLAGYGEAAEHLMERVMVEVRTVLQERQAQRKAELGALAAFLAGSTYLRRHTRVLPSPTSSFCAPTSAHPTAHIRVVDSSHR